MSEALRSRQVGTPALGGDVFVGPRAGPDALVERVRREVRAGWPDDGARLWIDGDSGKPGLGSRLVEYWAAHPAQHFDFAGAAVGEREAQNSMAHPKEEPP